MEHPYPPSADIMKQVFKAFKSYCKDHMHPKLQKDLELASQYAATLSKFYALGQSARARAVWLGFIRLVKFYIIVKLLTISI